MSPAGPDPLSIDDGVHQPRTIAPGLGAGPVLRPRTIGALGRPEPIIVPSLESFSDPTWSPPTGPVPVVPLEVPDAEPVDDLDDIWVDDAPVDHDVPADAPAPIDDPALAAEVGAAETEAAVDPTALDRAEPPARLLRNNLLVASGTALSRLTGLARTALIFVFLAQTLGDAYLLANNTPNIIYELILGGVLTATLVPIFTDDLENGDGDATSAVISFTLVALVVLSIATALLSPALMYLYSQGSPAAVRDEFLSTGIKLALLFAPQVFFYGLMALWSAVLNARHRFFAAAWAPVLNNVIVIGVLLAVWRTVDGKPTIQDVTDRPALLVLLGLGTTAGIAVMALSLYPALRRSGMRLRFRFSMRHPAVRRAIRLSAWTFGYVIANQISGLVVSVLAKPASGGVRDYQTAFQFFQLPHGLLAVSIMVTFEPLLGRAEARRDRTGFNRQLLLGFRLIGLLIIPAAVGYLALPLGLDHRTFEATGDLHRALGLGGIVAAFAVGLPGFSTYLYALRGFYAMKDTRTPFLVNCFENVVNVVAAVVLVRWFDVVGLALSFAIAYTVAAGVAVVLLTRRSPGFDWRGLVATWVKLLVAATAMGAVVFGTVALAAPGSALMLVPAIAGGIAVGGVVYVVAIRALRVPGIDELMGRLPGLRRFAG